MPDLPFPVTSTPGQRAQEGGGRLINCFASEVTGSPQTGILWERSAGTRRFAEIPEPTHIGCRGLVTIGGTLIHLPNGQCYAVDANGTMTFLGALGGDQPFTFGQNIRTPTPDTFAVSDGAAWLLFAASAPTTYDGGGNLIAPNSVHMIDNYAIFTAPGGSVQSTELNSTTLPSNSQINLPEGNLLRGVEFGGESYLFGRNFFRVYRNVGADPFPLEYTGVKRDVGIAGTHAVAGFEPGWPDALVFAGSDNRVYRMEGYNPVPISENDVQRDIEDAGDARGDLRASAYLSEGKAFWSLTLPGQWTWEYNLQTNLWHERESYQRTDWRHRSTVNTFNDWIVGDDTTGNLYRLINNYPFEGEDDPLIWTLESGIIQDRPNRINIPWTWFNFTAGVGLDGGSIPIQTDPQVRIFWSKDGGATYGQPLRRALGGEGDDDQVVRIGPTGDATIKGIRFRLVVSDTVRVGFMGASFGDINQLAA